MSKPLTCLLSLLTQETLDTGTEHALHRKDTFFPLSLSLLPPPRLCATVSVSFLLTPYQRLAPPHLVYSHLTEITWWAKGRFISDYGLSSGTLLACPDLRMLLAPLFTPHWDFEVWLDSGGSWKNCHGLAWLVQMRLPPERIGRVGSAAFRLISTVQRVG